MGAEVTPKWNHLAGFLEAAGIALLAITVLFLLFAALHTPLSERVKEAVLRRRHTKDIVVVRFLKHQTAYRAGELAGRSPERAVQLVEEGQAEYASRRDKQRAARYLTRLRDKITVQSDESSGFLPDDASQSGFTWEAEYMRPGGAEDLRHHGQAIVTPHLPIQPIRLHVRRHKNQEAKATISIFGNRRSCIE
jgi:hypothetical protein